MAEQLNDRESSGLADKLMQYLPVRFRPGTAVVPVVRLSGVIGAVTPLRPGLTLASVARVLERAFFLSARQGGGAGDQFARRLAGAVAPDLLAHQAARG